MSVRVGLELLGDRCVDRQQNAALGLFRFRHLVE